MTCSHPGMHYPHYWQEHALHEEIDAVAAGSFLRKEPLRDPGKGACCKSDGSGRISAFRSSESFQEGCLLAVNLGDDADTTGAIYAARRAFYGEEGIPAEWLDVLAKRELIEGFAEKMGWQNGSRLISGQKYKYLGIFTFFRFAKTISYDQIRSVSSRWRLYHLIRFLNHGSHY